MIYYEREAISVFTQSLDLLRRIRTATSTLEDLKEEGFLDAEKLVDEAGEYYFSRFNDFSTNTQILRTIVEKLEKYKEFKPTATRNYNPNTLAKGICYNLMQDPFEIIGSIYKKNFLDMIDQRSFNDASVGVFVPLSSDYLTIRLIQKKMVEWCRDDGEDIEEANNIKPFSISGDFRTVVLPLSFGKRVFEEKKEVILLLDTVSTGRTHQAALKAINEHYSDKLVEIQKKHQAQYESGERKINLHNLES